MYFQSTVTLGPLDDAFDCMVEVIHIPADPDTGYQGDWDVFVRVGEVDVSYDISSDDRLRLIQEAIEHEKERADDALIDRFEYDRSFDL